MSTDGGGHKVTMTKLGTAPKLAGVHAQRVDYRSTALIL